jgi:hypothetical protein
MIAGVIKSSLPQPCSMTVPESAVISECFCGEARREGTLVVAFRHAAGDLIVRIWEWECETPPVKFTGGVFEKLETSTWKLRAALTTGE